MEPDSDIMALPVSVLPKVDPEQEFDKRDPSWWGPNLATQVLPSYLHEHMLVHIGYQLQISADLLGCGDMTQF